MLRDMPERYVSKICEILHNMLQGVCPPNKSQKRQLCKYKRVVRALGNPPFTAKKKILINQKGSGLFTAILPIIASILLGSTAAASNV
jgi:hypothetical protein